MQEEAKIADQIKGLRGEQRSQAEFGALVDVGQTTVSAWESGATEPSPEAWLKLGNLAGYPRCLFFWRRAGLDVGAMLSAAGNLLKERSDAALAEVISVPYLGEGFEESQKAGRLLALPGKLMSNPGSLTHLVIGRDVDTITVSPGDVVVLDRSQNSATDLVPFLGQTILAEMQVSRALLHMHGPHGGKTHVGYKTLCMGRVCCEIVGSALRTAFRPNIVIWRGVLQVFGEPESDVEAVGGEIVIGQWRCPFPATIEYPKGLAAFEAETREQAAREMKPPSGILGIVKGWFPSPSKSGGNSEVER